MRRILKRHEVLADEWRHFGVDATDGVGGSDAVIVPLAELRETPGLEDMLVVRKGQRLSVMPVTDEEWAMVMKLAGEK